MEMRRWIYCLAMMLLCFEAVARDFVWADKNTVILDGAFQVSRPGTDWHLKADAGSQALVWVNTQPFGDCWIRVTEDAIGGGSARDYAAWVKSRLEKEGLQVDGVRRQMISGQDVYILSAHEKIRHLRHMIGAWGGRSRNYRLDCVVPEPSFKVVEPQCLAAIQSGRFVNFDSRY